MVSELVDQVLGQLDDERSTPPATRGGGTPPDKPVREAPPSTPIDIQVELDPPAAETGFDDPDQPLIEHDVDPFESASGPASGVTSVPADPTAADDDESLDLITDPLRRSSHSGDAKARTKETAPMPSGPLSGAPSDAKVLEIPVTVDVDALREGRAIKIVLTLRG